MAIKSFFQGMFSSKQNLKIETKSGSPYSPFMSFVNFLAFNGWSNLSAYQSMQYYMQVSPLFDAIKKISQECSTIKLFVQDCVSEKYDKVHPLLSLLRKPNTDMGAREWIDQVISYYLITGNAYICATGSANRAPLELFALSPEYITLIPDERDGYTRSITYTSSQRGYTFNRKVVDGRFRFYTDDENQEIYHIRAFNPIKGITNNYGLSPEAPIYYEIEQYIKAGVHNLSLLTRGARPSGALTTAESLTDAQFSRLQEQADRFYSGPENAGRMHVFDNGLTFTEMGISNKDMDFEKLKINLTMQIYNSFNIPLPLISPSHMTLDNYDTAKLAFYDFAVLPTLGRILEELSNFLMYRYGQEGKKELVYNKESIPALQLRRNQELLMTKNLGVNTINEIRAMKGDKPAIGGDDIYSAMGAYPIGRVPREIEEVERVNDRAEATDKSMYLDYKNMLQKVRNNNGQLVYTDDQIKLLGARYGINE